MKRTTLILIVLALIGGACAVDTAPVTPGAPSESVEIPDPPRELPSEPSVWLSGERADAIRDAIDRGDPIAMAALAELTAAAETALTHEPSPPEVFELVGVYEDVDPRPEYDAANRRAMKLDANAAYASGLAYALTGDERHAGNARRIVLEWMTVEFSGAEEARLNVALHFPGMIIAIDSIRGSNALTDDFESAFAQYLVETIVPLRPTDPNNHTDWGLVLTTAVAAFLGSDDRLDQAADAWRSRLDAQMTADGVLWREVVRHTEGERGINYTHVALHAMTLSAEMLSVNGRDVYSYETSDGKSLRLGFEISAPWVADPGSFPFYEGAADDLLGVDKYAYWEVLDDVWGSAPVDRMLDERRPIETVIGFEPFLSLTHGPGVSVLSG